MHVWTLSLLLLLAILSAQCFKLNRRPMPSTYGKNVRIENQQGEQAEALRKDITKLVSSICLATTLMLPPQVYAVSGGGKDYAQKDITGMDFSKQSYVGKDFTQCIGKTTNFQGSILKGTRFYKAYLKDADFTGADLSTASLEDTTLEGAIFKNAVLEGAYLSASILEAKTIENVDFTDAQMPEKILKQVCQRPDLTGTNPKTGVATAESLFCE